MLKMRIAARSHAKILRLTLHTHRPLIGLRAYNVRVHFVENSIETGTQRTRKTTTTTTITTTKKGGKKKQQKKEKNKIGEPNEKKKKGTTK